MKEHYFVTSDGDMPDRIYFNFEDAKKSLAVYIDSFSKSGERIEGYKRIDYDNLQSPIDCQYTTDF